MNRVCLCEREASEFPQALLLPSVRGFWREAAVSWRPALRGVFCVCGQVLCEDITKSDIEAVLSDLLHLYDMEAKCV